METMRFLCLGLMIAISARAFYIDMDFDYMDPNEPPLKHSAIKTEGVETIRGLFLSSVYPYQISLGKMMQSVDIPEIYFKYVFRPLVSEYMVYIGQDNSTHPIEKEGQLTNLTFQCLKGAFLINDLPEESMNAVCRNHTMSVLTLRIWREKFPMVAEISIWDPARKTFIKTKREMTFHPDFVSLLMNGFLEEARIYQMTDKLKDPLKHICWEGCKSCLGKINGNCLECELGYYGVQTPNGMICVESTAKRWTFVIISIITLLYIWGRLFARKHVMSYRCLLHHKNAVSVAISCGHMLCGKCASTVKNPDGSAVCPVCKAILSKQIPISFDQYIFNIGVYF